MQHTVITHSVFCHVLNQAEMLCVMYSYVTHFKLLFNNHYTIV